MLQKFALAFKTKTVEFFAEEEGSDDDDHACGVPSADLDPAEEIITGQRVVAVKPDRPNDGEKSPAASPPTALPSHHHRHPQQQQQQLQTALVSSLFAAVSSFHAAYLNLQTAHEPFHLDSIRAADRAAVSHLRHLSDLRRAYRGLQTNPSGASQGLPLSSHLEAEVLENQSMLRRFETIFNQLQSDVDRKDAEVSHLKQQLREMEASNLLLERKLGTSCPSAAIDEGVKLLLSIGVFDAILREACKAAHGFTKTLIDLLKGSGWDLEAVAKSIYPGVDFVKRGHRGYALLSYVCLGMFGGFGSEGFDGDGAAPYDDDLRLRRRDSLRQFVEHCSDDPIDLLNGEPQSDFARFCESKHHLLVHPDIHSSLLGEFCGRDALLGSWQPSSPLYEPFVTMCSLVWMLHKLAMAFDRAVEIFQVQQGVDFSMVFMENVVWRRTLSGSDARTKPKVGFTVVPGFRLGAAVIQCRVYLNYTKFSS
uniref:Cell cycle progression protein 1 n=1 Tax=Anthurium amnicola TaxID=1678845 RepID=A0A1D1ZBP3_9ARAE